MSDKKVIAVLGATGAQGGGLVRAILDDPEGGFAVRAITRNASSEKAKQLAAQGAEVVEADLDDVESLKKAFAGAYGIYAVTNFWEHFSPEKELAQARNIAEAAKASNPQHVIWSTLEDTRKWVPLESDQMPTIKGKYKVPHFDAKGEADAFFGGLPTTFLLASFYWDNFIHFGSGPQRTSDGKLALTLPIGNEKMAGVAAEDIGRTAYGIFKSGSKEVGKRIGVAGGHLTGEEMARKLSNALGVEVGFAPLQPAEFRALGFPGADDLGNMFQFYRDFEPDVNGLRSVENTRSYNPKLQDFESWLGKHKDEIPLP